MSGDVGRDPQVRQDTAARRDAYTARVNQVVVHFPSAEQAGPRVSWALCHEHMVDD